MRTNDRIRISGVAGLSIKLVFGVMVFAGIFLASGRAHAVEAPVVNPEVYAQTMADVDAKNQMLQAKHELWTSGTTKAMKILSDGSYIGGSAQAALLMRQGSSR